MCAVVFSAPLPFATLPLSFAICVTKFSIRRGLRVHSPSCISSRGTAPLLVRQLQPSRLLTGCTLPLTPYPPCVSCRYTAYAAIAITFYTPYTPVLAPGWVGCSPPCRVEYWTLIYHLSVFSRIPYSMPSASVPPTPGGYFGLSCCGNHCPYSPLPYVLVSNTPVYAS